MLQNAIVSVRCHRAILEFQMRLRQEALQTISPSLLDIFHYPIPTFSEKPIISTATGLSAAHSC
jgi:hypothetical protein